MRAIVAIALKDIRSLWRDRAALFFVLFFPILIALFFGAIFKGGGGGGKLDVALVNEDGGPASVRFAADLKADNALRIIESSPGRQGGPPTPLTRAMGSDLVRRGGAVACVILPKGFEEDSRGMLAGRSMRIEGIVTPGRAAEGGLLTGKLNEIAFKGLSSTFTDTTALSEAFDSARASVLEREDISPAQRLLFDSMFGSIESLRRSFPEGASPAGEPSGGAEGGGFGWRPVVVNVSELTDERQRPRSSWEISFAQGVVWGLMGCVTGFGVSIARERSRGTLMRLTTAPIGRGTILAGKALACFAACMAVQAVLLAMAVLVLGVRVGQPVMMLAAMVASAVGFVGVMMLLAGLSRSEDGASGLGRGLLIVLALIGGGSVPLFLLPPFAQTMSGVSPFKWATVAIEGALWRSYSWGEFALPAGVLIVMGVAGLAVGWLAMRWTDR